MFVVSELIIYLVLFYHIHVYNETLKTKNSLGLSKETLNGRRNQNIIHLAGQCLSFVIEMSTLFIAQLITVYGDKNNHIGIVPSILIFVHSLMTICFILTSHELRKFYFEK